MRHGFRDIQSITNVETNVTMNDDDGGDDNGDDGEDDYVHLQPQSQVAYVRMCNFLH